MTCKNCLSPLAVLVVTFLMASSAPAESPVNDSPEIGTIFRSIETSERGFTDGWSFSRLTGEAEVYFPVSDALISAELVLDIAQSKVRDSQRSLRILAGDVVIYATDPDLLGTRDQLRIPIDPTMAEGDFLRIRVQYSGALSDDICVDERASGDFFRILPSSRLLMDMDEEALVRTEEVLRLQPEPMTVLLSEKAEYPANVLAAALRAATIFGAERGFVNYRDFLVESEKYWESGIISIDSATENAANVRSALRAELFSGLPGVSISGREPQDALELLRGNWAPVAGSDAVSIKKSSRTPQTEDSLSFAELGFDVRPFMSSGNSLHDFNFDIASVPAGQRIASISLVYTIAQDARAEGATIAMYLNDRLIGSQLVRDGERNRFEAELPEGLVARNNQLRVQILRPVVEGKCLVTMLPLPAQIHGGSQLNLTPKPSGATDFHDLRQQMQAEVEVLVADIGAFDAGDLQSIAPIFASVVPPSAHIKVVSEITAEASAPFVHIADTPLIGSAPALVYNDGDVELTTFDGELVLAGGSLQTLTSAQIVRVGDREGLWIRPAQGFELQPGEDRPVMLDQGDVALLDSDGVVVVTSSSRSDLIDIHYNEGQHILAVLNRYRLWFIGLAWIVLSIVTLEALRRTYASQRKSDGSN